MITKEQATVGRRVRWQSLDETIRASYGKIVAVDAREFEVEWEDGERIKYYLNNSASRVSPI